MKKKVMILGAGIGQIPFICICKQKGYNVIVISPQKDEPGFEFSDQNYYIDTRNKEQILEIAKYENIDAILSDQTDVAMPTVAYVSEQMGLKTIGYEKSIQFSDKYIMRQQAKEIGISVPNFFKARTLEEAEEKIKTLQLPVIMKPVDSSGSKGVVKLNFVKDLYNNFESTRAYSRSGYVIIEEFIVGREYLVDGLALEGKYINTDLGLKEHFDKEGNYISKMCMLISAEAIFDETEKAILDTNKKLVEGLELSFGITHGEYIVSDIDQKVYLVEIAARGGGIYVSSHLTPIASGINVNEIIIDYIVSNKIVDIEKLQLEKKVSAWMCFALQEGIVKEIINKEKLYDIEGVFKVCLDKMRVGKKVSTLSDDASKYGPILIKAKDREDCYDKINKIRKIFDVVVLDEDNNESHIIW